MLTSIQPMGMHLGNKHMPHSIIESICRHVGPKHTASIAHLHSSILLAMRGVFDFELRDKDFKDIQYPSTKIIYYRRVTFTMDSSGYDDCDYLDTLPSIGSGAGVVIQTLAINDYSYFHETEERDFMFERSEPDTACPTCYRYKCGCCGDGLNDGSWRDLVREELEEYGVARSEAYEDFIDREWDTAADETDECARPIAEYFEDETEFTIGRITMRISGVFDDMEIYSNPKEWLSAPGVGMRRS